MKSYYQEVIKHVLCITLFLSVCLSKTVPFRYAESDNIPVPRVINGWPATLGEAPYQVALKSLVRGTIAFYRTFCSAVIVAPKKLITAAHCILSHRYVYPNFRRTGFLEKKILSDKCAVAGSLVNRDWFMPYDSKTGGQWRLFSMAYYPLTYQFPKDDIAFALTVKRFVFNEYVAPIPIASVDLEYHGSCIVSGYGRTSRGDLANHVLGGDSGGPIVCSNTGDPNEGRLGLLVGITSGYRLYAGSYFTRVSKYKYFLKTDKARSIGRISDIDEFSNDRSTISLISNDGSTIPPISPVNKTCSVSRNTGSISFYKCSYLLHISIAYITFLYV